LFRNLEPKPIHPSSTSLGGPILSSTSRLDDYTIKNVPHTIVLAPGLFALQQSICSFARSPRFALDYKFPATVGQTKLINITPQVGSTGVLTFVAEIEPLAIGAVRVSSATLHNYQEIIRKDIRINDYVFLQRAVDVYHKLLP
jgi:NAD-dependent DNA ligase